MKIEAELPELENVLNDMGKESWCLITLDKIGGGQVDPHQKGMVLTRPIYHAVFSRTIMEDIDVASMLGIDMASMPDDEDDDFDVDAPTPIISMSEGIISDESLTEMIDEEDE
jgi:hypothetical protein